MVFSSCKALHTLNSRHVTLLAKQMISPHQTKSFLFKGRNLATLSCMAICPMKHYCLKAATSVIKELRMTIKMEPAKSEAGRALAKAAENVYESAIAAKERGEMVGWIASNSSPRKSPPPWACTASTRRARRPPSAPMPMLEHAKGELGYSNDLCAYARISMAYASLGECPNAEREMPKPGFVLC